MPDTDNIRTVFFVSDRTGITAENLGHALLTQFRSIRFEQHSLAYIDSVEKAKRAAELIEQSAQSSHCKPLVFSTLIDSEFRAIINQTNAHIIDLFDAFIAPLEAELHTPSSHAEGLSHGIDDENVYMSRMDAVNFALQNDDGASTKDYKDADVILVGVSRSGKTPTCLYLAMQFGLRASNYPLTEHDMQLGRLPTALGPYREKIIALKISAERLHKIREIRRHGSSYASLSQCKKEIRMLDTLLTQEQLDYLESSYISIEEIATSIIHKMNLTRPSYY